MNDQDTFHDAFPADAPSAALRARVGALAALPVPVRAFPARPAFLVGGGCALAAVAGAFLLGQLPARRADAKPPREPHQHRRTVFLDAQGKERTSEEWVTPDAIRMETRGEGGPFVLVADRRKGFSVGWQPDAGDLRLDRSPTMPNPIEPIPILDEAGLAALARASGRASLRLEDGVLDGRPVKQVETREVTLYADPQTLRAIAYESTVPAGRVRTYVDEAPPPSGAFMPEIEYAGRRIDVFEERKRLEARFGKPLATYRVPEGTVEIRHVAMNRSGDLFVLYTGVKAAYGHNVLPSWISDDAGGVYAKGIGFNPYQGGGKWPGFSFGGKPLEGAWYARLGAKPPKTVRIGFRRQWPPGQKAPAFTHAWPVTRANGDLLDFQPFMAMGFASERRLAESRAFALATHYERNGRWADMEREMRRNIALNDAFSARRGRGNGYVHALLAKALARQGEREAARAEAAVARSRVEPRDGDGLEHVLREAGL